MPARISIARLASTIASGQGAACRPLAAFAFTLPSPASSAPTSSRCRSHTTSSSLPTRFPPAASVLRSSGAVFSAKQKHVASSTGSGASARRGLATHSDEPFKASHHPGGKSRPETVEETLRRLETEARKLGDGGRDHAGPFPLGVGPSGRNKTWKSWRELRFSGKLWRTTQQMGNLTIILVGVGLLVILSIALSTELFAKNSPSVLYSQCIDMIRDSDALNAYFLPPMSFTHSPHSSAPTRGTAPVVHRAVRHPSSGRDHLILTFWVHGRGRDEPEPLGWAKRWWAEGETQLRKFASFVGLVEPVEDPTAADAAVAAAHNAVANAEAAAEEQGPGFLGRLTSAFAFRGPTSGVSIRSASRTPPPPGTYKVGEVRADYVKNAAGHYTMLALVVDVPSSRAPYPGRALVFWSPEADREGLLGRRSG